MTDTNIIHALQCCGVATNCRNCPLYEERSADCIYTVLKNALDLITRQQAEIENLKVENQSLRTAGNSLKMHYEEAQAEIDKLKECPKCVYEYDGEIKEYCVQGPCSNFKTVGQVKSEAYKEFAEKLKEKSFKTIRNYGLTKDVVEVCDIDNLLKEMVGEDNA